MQSHRSQPDDHKWRQAFWFGLPLAALNLGLLALTALPDAWLSTQQAILSGFFIYLLIPAIAGYHFCYRWQHEGWESGWAGFRVGLVGCGIFMLATTVWLVIAHITYDNTPPEPGIREFHPPTLALIVEAIIFMMLAWLNLFGLLIGAAGGRIGGALAIRRAAMRVRLHEHQI